MSDHNLTPTPPTKRPDLWLVWVGWIGVFVCWIFSIPAAIALIVRGHRRAAGIWQFAVMGTILVVSLIIAISTGAFDTTATAAPAKTDHATATKTTPEAIKQTRENAAEADAYVKREQITHIALRIAKTAQTTTALINRVDGDPEDCQYVPAIRAKTDRLKTYVGRLAAIAPDAAEMPQYRSTMRTLDKSVRVMEDACAMMAP